MLPNDHKPWAKPLARIVIGVTMIGLALLTWFLHVHRTLHISEMVGVFLLFLTIVPPNLAVLYPGLLPKAPAGHRGHTMKSTLR